MPLNQAYIEESLYEITSKNTANILKQNLLDHRKDI